MTPARAWKKTLPDMQGKWAENLIMIFLIKQWCSYATAHEARWSLKMIGKIEQRKTADTTAGEMNWNALCLILMSNLFWKVFPSLVPLAAPCSMSPCPVYLSPGYRAWCQTPVLPGRTRDDLQWGDNKIYCRFQNNSVSSSQIDPIIQQGMYVI